MLVSRTRYFPGAGKAHAAQRGDGQAEEQAVPEGADFHRLADGVVAEEFFRAFALQAQGLPDGLALDAFPGVLTQGTVGGGDAAALVHDQHAVGSGVEDVFKAAFFQREQAQQIILWGAGRRGGGLLDAGHLQQTGVRPEHFKGVGMQAQELRCRRDMIRGDAGTEPRQQGQRILKRHDEGLEAAEVHACADAAPAVPHPGLQEGVGPAVGILAQGFEGGGPLRAGMPQHRFQEGPAGGHAIIAPGRGEGQIPRRLHAQGPELQKAFHADVEAGKHGRGLPAGRERRREKAGKDFGRRKRAATGGRCLRHG